ncbi:MAG TPA: M23 family metallopeptidase [Chromatiaceae bacterium]|nr:M23 family metallopeptidase [Chromatiaceae bacterium]HIN81494.1 M23 family metallopeptidase [Chromatiales bacterium]HIA09447.1 M23 family metallopeptidase [Chromatiaceae bacterium]HIB83039.1 M23 family metallopeptidase [Chromatiaceae bacterium]HIO14121.1 M23 family metallopeptidase [Chromatiales bacterium]
MNNRSSWLLARIWCRPQVILPLLVSVLMLAGVAYLVGVQVGASRQTVVEIDSLRAQWEVDRESIADLRQSTRDDLDALASRVGQAHAHLIRLDALGERLTEIASLDQAEFDFSHSPAQGGPEEAEGSSVMATDPLLAVLDELDLALGEREQKLSALESLLSSHNLAAESRPEGRPVTGGWISSYFGKRTDPFTGKQATHHGMDFAGKQSSDVVAVAAGVVSSAGKRSGYGNMVELRHGGGFVTRYGHNEQNLVTVGDRVEKGQVIALMGSTGRSTGPHVHFEVVRHGNVVDPSRYLRVSH